MRNFITEEIKATCKSAWDLYVRQVGKSNKVVLWSKDAQKLGKGTNSIASAIYYIESQAALEEKHTSYAYGPIDDMYYGCTAIVTFKEPKK